MIKNLLKKLRLPWDDHCSFGYKKIDLFSSNWLGLNLCLFKFPVGMGIPTHTDPIKFGYRQLRLNFHFGGPYHVGQRFYVLGRHRRLGRFVYFSPDTYSHGLPPQEQTSYMISLGWLRKVI